MRNYCGLVLGFMLLSMGVSSTALANNSTSSHPFFYCPKPNELVKDPDKKTWSAQNRQWRSYEISFIERATHFLGAQWTGANVGQLTCVYKGNDPNAFPILLIFRTLVYAPNTGKWSKDLGGFRNCKTRDPKMCPFKIRFKQREQDINLQLEQLKNLPYKRRE